MAPCRCDIIYSSSLQETNPYTLIMADMHMLIITPLKPNTSTLSRPIPTRHLGGNGVKQNCRLQLLLLCEDWSVNMKFDFTLRKNTPIYSRKKPLNCYHGGYTYRWISCLLRRLPQGQQVDLNDIILRKKEEKWRFVVSSQNKL